MDYGPLIASAVIVLAGIYFVFREYRRKNPARRLLRIISTVSAFAAILILIVPIRWKTGIAEVLDERPAVLLTEGFSRDSINSFLSAKKDIPVYTTDDLYRIDPEITELHIFGYGLPVYARPLPETQKMIFHEPPLINGFSLVSWNRKISAGELLDVQGKYKNHKAYPVILKLLAFGVSQDSVIIPAHNSISFSLSATPKFRGRAVYRLIALHNNDTTENNSVPISVTAIDRPAILMLSSSPDFEQKFLQEWLAGEGYALMSKVRISKDKIEKNYFNFPRNLPERISPEQLKHIRILICDANEYVRLTAGEKQSIMNAVTDHGLGLLIRADSVLPDDDFIRRKFSVAGLKTAQGRVEIFTEDASKKISLPVDGGIRFIRPGKDTRMIIRDSSGNAFVSNAKQGYGNISVSVLSPLYPLVLSGNTRGYANIWSAVLNQLAEKQNSVYQPEQLSALPLVDEPMDFRISSSADSLPEFSINNVRISLAQDPLIRAYSFGKYWPRSTGWVKQVIAGRDSSDLYIFNSADWKNIKRRERVMYTKQLIKNGNNSGEKLPEEPKIVKKIAPVFLFLILILSSVFLWIEKKLA